MRSNNKFNNLISLKNTFIALASKKLTKKERLAIEIISKIKEPKNSNKIVEIISNQINCAKSTSWAVFRSLIKMRLIIIEKERNKVVITKSAKLLIKVQNDF
jgi:hypothetical protein